MYPSSKHQLLRTSSRQEWLISHSACQHLANHCWKQDAGHDESLVRSSRALAHVCCFPGRSASMGERRPGTYRSPLQPPEGEAIHSLVALQAPAVGLPRRQDKTNFIFRPSAYRRGGEHVKKKNLSSYSPSPFV